MSKIMMRFMFATTAVASVLALFAGCANMGTPKVEVAEPTTALPQAIPKPPVATGAIFQATAYRPLFEDHRARLVGDSITVTIVETVNASQSSTSTLDKSGNVTGSITALPFLKSSALTRASVAGSSDNTFSGKGSTANNNNFAGTITAVVTGVLPNGHLMIAGEKQIGVNENVDVLRFSGQVDPTMILPGNTIASAQIANVRIEHRGRGQQADAQGIGWLGRFFLNILPI